MNEEKIKEVFSDEEFVKSLMEMETPEDVQKALEEKDIDLSIDEIKMLAELLQKKANGELTEDELENVAGGGMILMVIAAVAVTRFVVVPLTIRAINRRW